MPYLIRALRGLAVVKLQQIEGALMARDRAGADHGCPRHDQLATQTLVRTFFVIVNERRMAARRCDSPRGTIRSKHFGLDRFDDAFNRHSRVCGAGTSAHSGDEESNAAKSM